MAFGEIFLDAFSKFTTLFGGVTVSVPIAYTGEQSHKSYLRLLSASYNGINNPEFLPKDGKTFCNEFVDSVAQYMGCNDFQGLVANDMIDLMSASPNWSRCEIDRAGFLASVGTLVVAGEKSDPHGHVCVVIPGISARSVHWSMAVPLCANVGKDVFIGKGISFAFRDLPSFFLWRPSL